MCHDLDSTRPVTQALVNPTESGDYPGSTLDILDVFGVNYDWAALESAVAGPPLRVGIITEMKMSTSTWTTFYEQSPHVLGGFVWTGAEYLGETIWPRVVGTAGGDKIFGLIDKVGEIKSIGYETASVWTSTPPGPPPLSSAAPAALRLAVDHPQITTDLNDVAYVRATVVDANGTRVGEAANTVTFSVTGAAGSIVAVDSGSPFAESYRGNVRDAYNGTCYAMVQMASSGTITISASADGLTGDSLTVTGVDGPFAPCTGACD